MTEAPRWLPYCGEAPGPGVWLERWNLDPVLWAGLAILAVVLWHPAMTNGGSRGQRRSLHCAWVLLVLLYVSPLCALSSAFFTARVVHHMALVLVVAPLLVFGLGRRLDRVAAPLWSSTALAAVVFWIWHAPGPYGAALSSVPVYALMQFSLAGSAVLFWTALRRTGGAPALAALLVTTVQMGMLAALITFAARPMYAPHFLSTLAWGVSPLEDQQMAGLTMWAPGCLAYLCAAVWIGWRWIRSEGSRTSRPSPLEST
ncbi:MAG: cytochrome c oxidase assembly protein [Pseudoxanthomonas sp.]